MFFALKGHSFLEFFHQRLKSIVVKEILNITLTFIAPIKTEMDDTLKFLFFLFFKKCLDISCELSAKQTIKMKCQDLF